MNGNCLDIGTIQAFLDGETRPDEAVRISDHVAMCDSCTMLLAQAEEESSLVYSVLDREMNTLVPTQRLWSRINESIAEEKSKTSLWQRLLAFVTVSLSNPSFAAAAGIFLVIGMVATVWTLNSSNTEQATVAGISTSSQVQSQPSSQSSAIAVPSDSTTAYVPAATTNDVKNGVTETKLPEAELKKIVTYANYKESGPKPVGAVPASAQYLPGEESYIKTINELEQGVTPQNAGMKASSQVAYARDMAVVDDSITKMREVVRKNPKNQAAKQILYSAYQDKIDLLKSSAQRDELMASLQ